MTRKVNRRKVVLGNPAERIPIGYESQNAGKNFYLLVPTKYGGRLALTISSGTPRTITVKKEKTQLAQEKAAILRLDLPPGKANGRYDVTIDADEKVKCELVQKSRARVSKSLQSDALVPWVFFYWPYGGNWPDAAAQTMAKFGRYTGLKTTGRKVRKTTRYYNDASRWETKNHKKKGGQTFEGHCHAASNASALFETPVEATVRSADGKADLKLSVAELKLLATEYYANYGQETVVWEPTQGKEVRVGDQEANWHLPAYFKPEGPWTRKAFEDALKECRFKEEDIESWVYYFASADGQSYQQGFLNAALHASFGESAATFFDTLMTQMLQEGQPLVSNMREASEGMSCSPVWNQVFYEYQATFVEGSSMFEMIVDCVLTANADNVNPSTPPLKYRHKWKLSFDLAGDIDTDAASNRWLESRLVQKGADAVDYKVYIPTDLSILQPCAKDRNEETPEYGGNPYVGHDLLDLIQVRQRFKA